MTPEIKRLCMPLGVVAVVLGLALATYSPRAVSAMDVVGGAQYEQCNGQNTCGGPNCNNSNYGTCDEVDFQVTTVCHKQAGQPGYGCNGGPQGSSCPSDGCYDQ